MRASFAISLVSLFQLFTGKFSLCTPPLISPDVDVSESQSSVTRLGKGDLYSVTLAHLPRTVTGEDFGANIIGNRLLKIKVAGTKIDWFFNLLEKVPENLELKPPVEAERVRGDHSGSVWKVSVIIPKHFYPVIKKHEETALPTAEPQPPSNGYPDAPQVFPMALPELVERVPREQIEGGANPSVPLLTRIFRGDQTKRALPTKPQASASAPELFPLPTYDN